MRDGVKLTAETVRRGELIGGVSRRYNKVPKKKGRPDRHIAPEMSQRNASGGILYFRPPKEMDATKSRIANKWGSWDDMTCCGD